MHDKSISRASIGLMSNCPSPSLSRSHVSAAMNQEEEKDCFGRDSIDQTLISSIVLLMFVAELARSV